MIEDELLKLRFKLGSPRRCGIYEKYLDTMLSVAIAFLNDAQAAEDIVHDVFVSLAQQSGDFRLTGNLKHYLATCVANRARDRLRTDRRHAARDAANAAEAAHAKPPEETLIYTEQARLAYEALSQLPPEQREAIVLRIKAGMSLKQIAQQQNVSYVAVQARYRRGIEALRSILNGKHEDETF